MTAPTYRKIVDCPDCGAVVKVPQGLTQAQAHQCEPSPRRRRTVEPQEAARPTSEKQGDAHAG